jgi:glycosyltransferase involved in cell wall biosynthesis
MSIDERAAVVDQPVAFTVAGDPYDPAAFSGAPASLIRAFEELGVPVSGISAELPGPWRRLTTNVLALGVTPAAAYLDALRHGRSLRLEVRGHKPKLLPSREMTALRSSVVRRRLRGRSWSRAIQFGSEYRLPAHIDYVTLDDATIVQLKRSYPYEWMQAVPEPLLRRMMARQRTIFRGARACCVLNRWAAESAVADYGVDPARVHVVGAGTNREIVSEPRDWRTPCFLFVGKDFRRKNGDGVVAAFAEVRARHPNAELHVVGNHPRLEEPGVQCHGPLRLDRPEETAELNSLFARSTCLVMPSWLEPTGYVHAEALAAGIGSIGTRAGGTDTLIGDAGVTVWPDDHRALVAGMLRFCEPNVMAEYGRRARERAPLFTWRAVAERVVRALSLPADPGVALAEFL